jgi:hypothetical protein
LAFEVYDWILGFVIWNLVLSAGFGAYLLFGAWDLEFITDHQNHNNLKN